MGVPSSFAAASLATRLRRTSTISRRSGSEFAELRLNTILAPVYWDLLEPEEGTFDFALVDGLSPRRASHQMRSCCCGSARWKNSMSCYAPAWVKKDPSGFRAASTAAASGVEILSPFSAANRDADARAFAALMKHLRDIDGTRHTVVMVQVENEIGMIPDARDHSEQADPGVRARRSPPS